MSAAQKSWISWGQDRTQGRYGIVPVPLLPGSPTGRLKHCTSLYIISRETIGIWESALRSRTPRAEFLTDPNLGFSRSPLRDMEHGNHLSPTQIIQQLGNWLCKACPFPYPLSPLFSPLRHLGRSCVQRSTRHCARQSSVDEGPVQIALRCHQERPISCALWKICPGWSPREKKGGRKICPFDLGFRSLDKLSPFWHGES